MISDKYHIASVRQLFFISFPLMMTAFSTNIMLLCDRVILSYHSMEAMNAATIIGNILAIIQFAGIKITYVSEVFVGQYNGSKQYERVAQPVWQMIWFSLLMFIITIPLGLFTGALLLPENFEKIGGFFYKLLIATAPILALIAALMSFYVGRGKVKFVTSVMIIGNAINIILDLILILGVDGFIEPMGIDGAAYATFIACLIQATVLFIDFLRDKNNNQYRTRDYFFDKKLFMRCLKVGIPNSAGLALDISAWAILILMLSHIKPEYITIHSIALTIFIFLTFFIDGLQKGITAVAANIIGAKKWEFLNPLLSSAIKIYLAIIAILFVLLVAFPEYTISLFFRGEVDTFINKESIKSLRFVWLFFVVDGIFWTYIAMLIAAGDTKFVMLVYCPSVLLLLIPVYSLARYFDISPSSLWIVIALYKILPIFIFILRYRGSAWKQKLI